MGRDHDDRVRALTHAEAIIRGSQGTIHFLERHRAISADTHLMYAVANPCAARGSYDRWATSAFSPGAQPPVQQKLGTL